MKTKTRKPRTSRSLTTTLAIAFLALSAVILLIFGGLQIFSNVATQQEAVAGKLQLNAQDASLRVSSFIQNKFSVMNTASRLTNLMKMAPAEQQQVLDGLLGRDVAFRQVVALNTQGQALAKSSRLSQQASGSLTDQIPDEVRTQIEQGNPYISSVYVDPITSEPLVLVATPVTNALGEYQGILAAEVNLKFMWDLVDQLKIGERGTAYVVDRLGDLIAYNDTARVLRGDNVANLTEVREFIRGNNPGDKTRGELFTGIQGNTVAGTFAPLGTPDWAVVVELPWEEAYREVIQNGIVSGAILVVMAVLAGLLGVYLARRLTVPVVSLTNTASQISAGELELQANVSGPREVAQLATSFNSMTAQLRNLISNLEDRVEARTIELEQRSAELQQRGMELEKLNQELQSTGLQAQRRATQLAASAQVARAIGQVRDLNQLLPQITSFISNAFGFYHVGIFIVDEAGRYAVLHAANSDGGQRMLGRQHKLEIGQQGIVGYVTKTGQPRIALDVGTDAVHFDNPDLPETRSELALPLQVGGQVFGALDVQSTQEAAFSQEDIANLGTLADQIAIAIENARLFAQSQAALQEAEEVNRRYLRQQWERLLPTLPVTSHEYCASGVPRLGETPLPEVQQAIQKGYAVIAQGSNVPTARSAVAVPVKLRDQVLGVIDLQETESERNWTADDLAILQAVADQAALALENVRLIDETERLAQREKAVADAADKIHRSTDLESVLRNAVAELNRITGLRGVSVQLGFGSTTASGSGQAAGTEGDR